MRAALVVMALAMVGCIEVTRAEYPPAPLPDNTVEWFCGDEMLLEPEGDECCSTWALTPHQDGDTSTTTICDVLACPSEDGVFGVVRSRADVDGATLHEESLCAQLGPNGCVSGPYGPPDAWQWPCPDPTASSDR